MNRPGMVDNPSPFSDHHPSCAPLFAPFTTSKPPAPGRSVHPTDTLESAAGLGGRWVEFCGLGGRFGVVERHWNHRQARRSEHAGGFSLGESVGWPGMEFAPRFGPDYILP
jgi:hypothetical protein